VQSISLKSRQKGTSQRWFPAIKPFLGSVGTGWFSLTPFSRKAALKWSYWEMKEARVDLFFGNPRFYCFFDGASQVALFSAESLDGFEPKLFFQLIRKQHAYSTHFQSPIFFIFCARFARVRCFSSKRIARRQFSRLFLLSFFIHLQFAYPHNILYTYTIIRVLVYYLKHLSDKDTI
jgi:hypothetical protein